MSSNFESLKKVLKLFPMYALKILFGKSKYEYDIFISMKQELNEKKRQ